MTRLLLGLVMLTLTGCGIIYVSPQVRDVAGDDGVKVVDITPSTVRVANRAPFSPAGLPAAFYQVAGGPGAAAGRVGAPAVPGQFEPRPGDAFTRLPPPPPRAPYRIGVGDVLKVAIPTANSVQQDIAGLASAQSSRDTYTVQDDGGIALPGVGRIDVAGRTIEEAEDVVFQRLVEAQVDPTFSIEVSEFNSRRVSVGGAVGAPGVVSVGLNPLYLDEAIAGAGGISAPDLDVATVRIYRDGTLYQVPAEELYSARTLPRVEVVAGDAVYVDTSYDLDRAQEYFSAQIAVANFKASQRAAALSQLNAQVALVQGRLADERSNFQSRLDLGAESPGFVYLAGEVGTQSRFRLPYGRIAHLADALYDEAGGVPTEFGNPSRIYVIRATADPGDPVPITAWRLNARNAVNLVLATQFELRPNDVVFVAEQPVTAWSRVLSGITPTLSIVRQATN